MSTLATSAKVQHIYPFSLQVTEITTAASLSSLKFSAFHYVRVTLQVGKKGIQLYA